MRAAEYVQILNYRKTTIKQLRAFTESPEALEKLICAGLGFLRCAKRR